MPELITAVSITIEIVNRKNVILDAKLNNSEHEFIKHLNIRYEIYKKNREFCSKMNSVNSLLNVSNSKITDNT